MSRRLLCIALPLAALTCAACSDNAPHAAGAKPSIGSDGIVTPGVGLVVVHNDFPSFTSSSISLLEPTLGQVTFDDCIDSGSTPPGVTTALSSDVVVPSWPMADHSVVVIDRTNAVLTWLDPATCTPKYQLDVSSGFFANPQDVTGASTTKAYVTRYNPNPSPTAAAGDHDDGNDLLIIDPSVPAITGSIDLTPYDLSVNGTAVRARPDHARLVNGTLFVTLNELSDDFETAVGHGRVLAIDTATDQVTATIDIPELADCQGLTYVEATHTLVVTCTGNYLADDPLQTSGIAYIDVTASPPVEVGHQMAAAFGGHSLGAYTGIADDGALGFGITPGDFMTVQDQLWSFDVAGGQATELSDATESFVYNALLVDPGHNRLYLTDATSTMPRLQVYDYSSGTATHQTAIETDPAHHLSPTAISWY